MTQPANLNNPRFVSEEEILKAIDKKIAQIKRLRKAADKADLRADEAVKKRHAFRHLRDLAEYKRLRAQRIEAHRLPQLKRKLAEFRTGLLPNSGITDSSVPKK